ncbi:MAG: ABC transporter substrate-binding protein [Natronospirillum sp.]
MKRLLCMGSRLVTTTLVALSFSASVAWAEEPLFITLINDSEPVFADYAEERNLGFRLGLEYAMQGSDQLAGRAIELSEIMLDPEVWELNQLPPEADLPPGDIWIAPVQARKAHRMIQYATESNRLVLVPATASDDLPVAEHPAVFRTFYRWRDVEQSLADWVPVNDPIWVTAVDSGAKLPPAREIIRVSPRSSGADAMEQVQNWARVQSDPVMVSSWPVVLDWLSSQTVGEARLAPGQMYVWLPDLAALSALRDFTGLYGLTYYYYDLPVNATNDWLVRTMLARYDRLPSHYVVAGMSAALALAAGLEAADGAAVDELQDALPGLEWQGPQGILKFTDDGETEQQLFRTRLRVQPQLNWARPVEVE